MTLEFTNPSDLCPTFGWTHVVAHGPGRMIHVSGQTAMNAHNQVVGPGDLLAQTEQTFLNLAAALAAAGATFADVVKMNLFVVGLTPEAVPVIRSVRKKYVSAERPPASTLVGVQALVHPDWLIEIDVTAWLPAD